MKEIMTFKPNYAVHPWESLLEAIEFSKMTQRDLAIRTWLTEKTINQIINWSASISPDTAIKLERTLGISMRFWNNLQKNYEEALAKINAEKTVQEELSCLVYFKNCYNELVKNDVFEKVNNRVEQYKQLLEFFWVDSLLYIKNTEAIAYRKALNKRVDNYVLAWRLRIWIKNHQKMKLPIYDEKKLKNSLSILRKLINKSWWIWKEVEDILSECGVGIVFSPYFSRTYVNGAARRIWDNPLIQLSMRWKSHDGLWFTLFHEIWHIILHGKKDQFVDYEWENNQADIKEKEANEFAASKLIPDEKYLSFVKNWNFSFEAIINFGKSIEIDIWIIAWRLATDHYISRAIANSYRKKIALIRK